MAGIQGAEPLVGSRGKAPGLASPDCPALLPRARAHRTMAASLETHHAIHSPAAHDPVLGADQALRQRQAWHGRLAGPTRRRPASRCSMPAAMRSMRRSPPRWRCRRSSRGTPGSAASASPWCTAPASRAPRWWISARRAPRGIDPALFKLTGRMTTELFAWPEVEDDTNIHGPLSVAIPSAVAGYDDMLRQWGRLPLADVIAPAIALARRGLPQDWFTAVKIANSARRYGDTRRGPRSICRTGCRRCRRTRARRVSSARATCRRRWSGWPGRPARFL